MKRWLVVGLLMGVLALAGPARAASLSGILLYATDDFGNPNGVKTILNNELDAQLWFTAPHDHWYVLGVWSGLPPDSLRIPPLNSPTDFTLEYPLADGENDFTILGQPGPLTRGDDYLRYALNLYFDGNFDQPAISVLFPRSTPPEGSPPSPNKANPGNLYSLSLQSLNIDPQGLTAYDDGVVRVTVAAASFLPPDLFGAEFNQVGPHQLTASNPNDPNAADYIGVLKILVEDSPQSAGSGPARGVNRFGIPADAGRPLQAYHGPDVPIAAPAVGQGQTLGQPSVPNGSTNASRPQWQGGAAAPPTAAATSAASPDETPEAAEMSETPTPPRNATAASRTTTPSPGAKTVTPASTAAGATPTPQLAGTAAGAGTAAPKATPTGARPAPQ